MPSLAKSASVATPVMAESEAAPENEGKPKEEEDNMQEERESKCEQKKG